MFHFLQIHTVPKEEEGSTWLQLFFDLVYVAILVELGAQLSHNLSLMGIVTFVIIFIPIWWSWMEYVDYGRRYPIDDIGQRILTVFYMATMLSLAFEIHSLTEVGATTLLITYGLSKFVLAVMYGRAWIYYPDYRHQTRRQAVAFIVAGTLWLIFAFNAPENPLFFAMAVIIGALLPLAIRAVQRTFSHRHDQPLPPIKYHFTLHRFGELTIIVLGELFIKLVTSSEGRELTVINYFMGAGILAISVSLWWLYFDHLEHANLAQAGSKLWIWAYGHFPFMVAITAYGVMGNHLFGTMPNAQLEVGQRLLFTSALATAVLTFGLIEYASKEKEEPLARSSQPWMRISVAAMLLAIGLFGNTLTAAWLVTIVAFILLLQVGLDVSARLQRPEPELAQNAA
jgi:low temperature requirement protein LtrA